MKTILHILLFIVIATLLMTAYQAVTGDEPPLLVRAICVGIAFATLSGGAVDRFTGWYFGERRK